MNPTDEVITWTPVWLTLLAVAVGVEVHLLVTFTRNSWREIDARLDRDMAAMVNGPARNATQCEVTGHGPFTAYASYRICLTCNTRLDQPYDQQFDGTDLGRWDQEMGA